MAPFYYCFLAISLSLWWYKNEFNWNANVLKAGIGCVIGWSIFNWVRGACEATGS